MTALLFDTLNAETSRPLRRVRLSQEVAYDEKWLQRLLFSNPGLVPIEDGQLGTGPFIPLCREFALPRAGGSVYLDLLGLTSSGRLVLVECKLWRNPQARREVIAQILEYAALLRGWSYGDLSVRLASTQGWRGQNPLFTHAQRWVPGLDEAAFADAITASLARGDFQLIVAGDGIRSDLQTIAAHINAPGVDFARLTLLEVQLWTDETRIVVVPHVPMRTVVIEQRVLIAANGMPAQLELASPATERFDLGATSSVPTMNRDPDPAARRAANRSFWDKFIAEVRFDHPDQPAPRHGGDNWVRLALPAPANKVTVYRSARQLGLFVTLIGPEGYALFETFAEALDAMRRESGLDLLLTTSASDPFKGTLTVTHTCAADPAGDGPDLRSSEAPMLSWLTDAANRMINLLRPRLAQHIANDMA